MSVFISHATKDDAVVERIQEALESLGIDVWIDSRELTGGDPLPLEVRNAIKERKHFIVVLSAAANNSQWVEKEFNYARKLKKKVIPVMLSGIGPGDLRRWFGKKAEPIGIPLSDSPGAVSNALPALLAALGQKLPADTIAAVQAKLAPVADLILELTNPAIDTTDGKRRATATAKLLYQPEGGSPAESEQFQFTAPLGPIEAEDLSWYLERYINWPSGVFQQRAKQVEANLPIWGRLLYDTLPAEALKDWRADPGERSLTIKVPKHAGSDEAATLLLSLPWELIHDEQGYLFEGKSGIRVRRRLPRSKSYKAVATEPPIRVLLVSPARKTNRQATSIIVPAPGHWWRRSPNLANWRNSSCSRRPRSPRWNRSCRAVTTT